MTEVIEFALMFDAIKAVLMMKLVCICHTFVLVFCFY